MAASNSTNSVDSSLWFDSFSLLLTDLENLTLSSDTSPSLVDKLKDNHDWFLNTLNKFKPPSESSKMALNSAQVNVGLHKLIIKTQFKELALKLSSTACLDEIQSYILVESSMDQKIALVDGIIQGFLHKIVLQYYTERQCLLKCARQMIIYALNVDSAAEAGKAVLHEVSKLISGGLEDNLISIMDKHLSSSYPQDMDVDLLVLWAEEMLIEVNLVLDILFLLYYESFSTCSATKWKALCLLYKNMTTGSSNFVKLGVSSEACKYCYRSRIQMLLILMETLNFESLLQMIHDEIPFRDNSFVFSSSDIIAMDSVICSFDIYETKEVGPLILAWAVFLCLLMSLSGKEENSELMEIDHVGYVRQAFKSGSLNLFLEILRSEVLNDSDGPVAGYRSILRTFISAFIASYEINIQLEDDTFKLILTTLCEIYKGEESLCVQFWDKGSIVDGPIRCLLCNLEVEFPYRTVELTRFLSALSEGCWPAECAYNFLERSVGISSLLEINSEILDGGTSPIIETQLPLQIPTVEGLYIPSKTRGRILRMIDENIALVRWEYKQSGMIVLLLRLAQVLELNGNEEVLVILDLFSRVVSFNMGVCFSMINIGKSLRLQMNYGVEQMEGDIWIDVIEVLCNLVRNLSPYSGSVLAMSMCVKILAKMMKCSPSHVSAVVMKMNIFDLSLNSSIFGDKNNGLLSGSWLLSGRLAKMLLIDCEHHDGCPLTTSVLEFTVQLLEAGVENDFVHALVMFCLQYVFVNHEYWKYKVKHDRWNVTLKVLEVLKISIISVPYLTKIGGNIKDIVLSDSSIHNMIFRIICTTSSALEKLYISRLYDWKEIDGLQHAICFMLNILVSILSIPENDVSGLPVFHQALLSNFTKPIPVVEALASLISYFRNPDIQVGAATALTMLCRTAERAEPYLAGNANFSLGGKQVLQLRHTVESIIGEQSERNEPLFVAAVELLTSTAKHQPAFLAAIFSGDEVTANCSRNNGDSNEKGSDSTSQALKSDNAIAKPLVNTLVIYVERSDVLIKRNARVLLSVLNLMKALWQGAVQYIDILEAIRKSKQFWKQLSECVLLVCREEPPVPTSLSENLAHKFASEYQCQSVALEIMALETFLQKKIIHAESLVRQADQSFKGVDSSLSTNAQVSLKSEQLENILLSWSDSSSLSILLKSSAACMYDTDIYFHAEVALSLLASHIIQKVAMGDFGCLSLPIVEEVTTLSTKLLNLPAFSDLSTQYTQHGYSERIHIKNLILEDLYYHLHGELEGRNIEHGPFKELSQFLTESNLFQTYQKKSVSDFSAGAKNVNFFDLLRLKHDIGFDIWDYSEWKASKKMVETVLLHLQYANSMLLIIGARLPSLRALITILTLNMGDSVNQQKSMVRRIPKDKLLSCIDQECKELQPMLGILSIAPDAPQEVLNYVTAQAELLLCLVKNVDGGMPSPTCLSILETCSFGLKRLLHSKPISSDTKHITMFLLRLLNLVVEICSHCISSYSSTNSESEGSSEVANSCLGMLPILCSCSNIPDQAIISVATIDLIIKRLLAPTTWLPIIQQYLQLQQLILKLHDRRCLESIPVIMKFLLTLASVRGGAEMIVNAGFLSSLKILFGEISYDCVADWVKQPENSTTLGAEKEKPQFIWGLGLAVLTETICSMGETSLCNEIVDSMISFFVSEKACLIAYHLSAPDFPSDDHDKKRARAQKRQTSLSTFIETEHTLVLLCILAKRRSSWVKATKEMGSELRGKIIHLLAFISRSHRLGESSSRPGPLLCAPLSKEENEFCKKPSFVNSRNGWFAAAALWCVPVAGVSDEYPQTAIVKVQENANSWTSTFFSDTVAIKIYKITFFILKFLILQAKDAAGRAEELGFIDLSSFPELPDPEILHCLQDQTIAIVTEICEANKSKQIQQDTQSVCLLLLNIAEMALYLEHCVSQICGIRPVLGRVEDFSKQMRFLVRATDGQTYIKSSMQHLKQIVSFVYPGLLQNEGIL